MCVFLFTPSLLPRVGGCVWGAEAIESKTGVCLDPVCTECRTDKETNENEDKCVLGFFKGPCSGKRQQNFVKEPASVYVLPLSPASPLVYLDHRTYVTSVLRSPWIF